MRKLDIVVSPESSSVTAPKDEWVNTHCRWTDSDDEPKVSGLFPPAWNNASWDPEPPPPFVGGWGA